MIRIVKIAVLVACAQSQLMATPSCDAIERDLLASVHPSGKISSWNNLSELSSLLKIEYMLPKDFIAEVNGVHGPLELRSLVLPEGQTRQRGVQIQLWSGRFRYVTFKLYPRKDVARAVEVDGLVLQNHMLARSKERLAADQKAAGMPPAVFRYAFDGLMTILAKGPFASIFVQSSQHYGVAKLYERVAGFRPYGSESVNHMAMIDGFRKQARNWPEAYRLKSVDQLVEALGAVNTSAVNTRMNNIWSRYRRTGETEAGMIIIKDARGRPYAIAALEGGSYMVRFVNLALEARPLYDWRSMCNSGACKMIRTVN